MGWLTDILGIYDRTRTGLRNYRNRRPQLILPPGTTPSPRKNLRVFLILTVIPVTAAILAVLYEYWATAKTLSADASVPTTSVFLGRVLLVLAGIATVIQVIGVVYIWIRQRGGKRELCLTLAAIITSVGVTVASYKLIDKARFAAEYGAFFRGVELFDQKNYDDAIAQFQRLVECSPSSRKAPNALGRIAGSHYRQGKYELSIAECATYLSCYPASDIAKNIRTTMIWGMTAFAKRHSDDECLALLDRMKTEYPNVDWCFLHFFNLGVADDPDSYGFGDLLYIYEYVGSHADKYHDRITFFIDKAPFNRSVPMALFLLGESGELLRRFPNDRLARMAFPVIIQSKYARIQIGYTGNKKENVDKKDIEIQIIALVAEIENALNSGDVATECRTQMQILRARLLIRVSRFAESLQELCGILTSNAPITVYERDKAQLLIAGIGVRLLEDQEWQSWRQSQLAVSLFRKAQGLEDFITVQRAASNGEYKLAWKLAQQLDRKAPTSGLPAIDLEALEFAANELGDRQHDPVTFAQTVLMNAKICKNAMFRDYPMEVLLVMPQSFYTANNLFYEAYNAVPKNDDLLILRARLAEYLYKTQPVSSDSRRKTRKECESLYSQVFNVYNDTQIISEALLKKGMIWLDNPWDLQRARVGLRSFITAFPDDDRANNALQWIAWSYCYEANSYLKDAELFIALYDQAADVFGELRERYPAGHLAVNAARAEAVIRDKLELVRTGKRKPYQLLVPRGISSSLRGRMSRE